MPLTLDFTPLPFGAAELPEPAVKTCTACGQTLPLEEFSPDKTGRLGRASRCRPCRAARQAGKRQDPAVRERERQYKAQYRAENREKIRQAAAQRRRDPEYREWERQADRQRADQYRARWTAPDGSIIEGDLSAPLRCTTVTNGGCGRMLTRGDFHAKRDRASGRQLHCRDCSARRDAERKAADRLKILDALLAEGHDRCHLCQGPFLPDDSWHIEHIHPRADEGAPDDLANLALAHDSCNLSKGSRDPFEVLAETLAEVGVDFHAAVRALQTYGQVVADLDEAA